MSSSSFNATGRLLDWSDDKAPGAARWWSEQASEVKKLGKGWRQLRLHPSSPLLSEIDEVVGEAPFLLRESGERLLLLAAHSVLVPRLLDLCQVRWHLYSPTVLVPELVTALTAQPGEYAIGALWAKSDAFGRSLRTIVFYGDDLGDAALFKEVLPRVRPYRVALRNVRMDMEVLSVSVLGEVGFTFSGRRSLEKADIALRFLTQNGYIDWNRPHSVA